MATASSIFCGRKRAHPDVKAGAEILGKYLPSWEERRNAEYIFWGTHAKNEIGQPWKAWRDEMKRALLKTQRAGRFYLDGSWDPVMGKLSREYGRLYTTAINCLTLETYYTYARANIGRRK